MPTTKFTTILYVKHPRKSAEFYQRVFDRAPVECSDNFALFVFDAGQTLGLWAAHEVAPASSISGGGTELAFELANKAEVDACHQRWSDLKLTIAQAPTQMDFGYTCAALDPDQHRLRVFAPA